MWQRDEDSRLSNQLAKLTSARKSTLQDADYVFLTSKADRETIQNVFHQVKKGTLENPQDIGNDHHGSETYLLQTKVRVTLKGPGIERKETLFIENGDSLVKRPCKL